jgi:predicted HTH transcriptional regulator
VIKVPTSLFLINPDQLKIEDIQSFCNQGLSEGIRLDYKKEITDNLKLAKTICAFANTQGGIILVGVKADKTTNIPLAIPGIELKEGLEEKIVNICLGNISPPVTPEVRVVDFKSNFDENKFDRAVFIYSHTTKLHSTTLFAKNQ